jgi:hypothetical protein
MPLKPFFSLQQILYRMSGIATQEARESAQAITSEESDKPGRLPVTVRPETRLFLEAQARLWGARSPASPAPSWMASRRWK